MAGIRFVAIAVCVASAALGADGLKVVRSEITRSKYYSLEENRVVLSLTVSMTVRNDGAAAVVIAKMPNVTTFSVFANEDDMRRSRAEYRHKLSPRLSFGRDDFESATPPSMVFATVAPGAELTLALLPVWIPVAKTGKGIKPVPNQHLFVVSVDPWPAPKRLAKEYQTRWKEHGSVLIDEITLPPIPFRVEADPKPEPFKR